MKLIILTSNVRTYYIYLFVCYINLNTTAIRHAIFISCILVIYGGNKIYINLRQLGMQYSSIAIFVYNETFK